MNIVSDVYFISFIAFWYHRMRWIHESRLAVQYTNCRHMLSSVQWMLLSSLYPSHCTVDLDTTPMYHDIPLVSR